MLSLKTLAFCRERLNINSHYPGCNKDYSKRRKIIYHGGMSTVLVNIKADFKAIQPLKTTRANNLLKFMTIFLKGNRFYL